MWPFAVEISDNIDGGSLVVALATFALALLTWRLARTATRSTKAAERSATVSERAATVAERSADAAERSAEVAQLEVDSIDMRFVIATFFPGDERQGGRRGPPARMQRAIDENGDDILHCRLLNIGSGPGIVHEVRLEASQPNQVPIRCLGVGAKRPHELA